MKVDGCELHPSHFADELREGARPAAHASAKNHLQRLALPAVGLLVDEHRHRRFRLAFPDVPVEGAQCHDAQAVQPHVAVLPVANVPGEDPFAVIVGGWLSERARTRNVAAARIEPVALDLPTWNVCHSLFSTWIALGAVARSAKAARTARSHLGPSIGLKTASSLV